MEHTLIKIFFCVRSLHRSLQASAISCQGGIAASELRHLILCIIHRAVASGSASPVLAGSLSAIGNFAKDQNTLIEQSVSYSNRTANTTPPIEQ